MHAEQDPHRVGQPTAGHPRGRGVRAFGEGHLVRRHKDHRTQAAPHHGIRPLPHGATRKRKIRTHPRPRTLHRTARSRRAARWRRRANGAGERDPRSHRFGHPPPRHPRFGRSRANDQRRCSRQREPAEVARRPRRRSDRAGDGSLPPRAGLHRHGDPTQQTSSPFDGCRCRQRRAARHGETRHEVHPRLPHPRHRKIRARQMGARGAR